MSINKKATEYWVIPWQKLAENQSAHYVGCTIIIYRQPAAKLGIARNRQTNTTPQTTVSSKGLAIGKKTDSSTHAQATSFIPP